MRFVKGQMPSLGRAQQPSRQCTTLGTTPERIKEKVSWSPGEKQRLVLAKPMRNRIVSGARKTL